MIIGDAGRVGWALAGSSAKSCSRAAIALLTLAAMSGCQTSNGTSEGETGTSASESGSGDTQTSDADTQTSDADTDAACTPELEALRDEIFTPSCALPTCHASADAAGGLDLETADLVGQLVGQPSGTCDDWIRVVPGAPDESLLYNKVTGPAACGNLMPPPGGLGPEQAACLGAWIEGLDPLDCETCGGDACVDLSADTQHCGECGNACPPGIACTAGTCSCPAGQELCGDTCEDTQADPQNCGGCDLPCSPDKVCWMGVCADTCGELSDCGGACVDTQTNPNHCGGCDLACAMGNACEQGGCGCPGDGVSFVDEVEPLLVDDCASMGCHAFPQPSAGLDLRVGNAYAELVDVPSSQCNNRLRVSPGQPANSYLMDKLLGANLCFGSKMPKGGTLTDAEIAMVSEWICRGAQP